MAPQAAALVLLAACGGPVVARAACSSDVDCSLNGVCHQGQCRCDAGWGGARCQTLQLLPAAPSNGYRQPNRSSWGGSVLREGDTFHMFVEEIVNGAPAHCHADYAATAAAAAAAAAGGGAAFAGAAAGAAPRRCFCRCSWLLFAPACLLTLLHFPGPSRQRPAGAPPQAAASTPTPATCAWPTRSPAPQPAPTALSTWSRPTAPPRRTRRVTRATATGWSSRRAAAGRPAWQWSSARAGSPPPPRT